MEAACRVDGRSNCWDSVREREGRGMALYLYTGRYIVLLYCKTTVLKATDGCLGMRHLIREGDNLETTQIGLGIPKSQPPAEGPHSDYTGYPNPFKEPLLTSLMVVQTL